MGVGSFFHHIGTFFLFCAFILLLIPSISSPVISGISILTVNYGDGDYTFGSWGYCQRQDGALDCTKKMVGYNPALVLRHLDPSIDISSAGENTSKALTRVMVLHPVGCVLAFIGFLLAAIGASTFKSFLASVFSGLAFIVTIVVLATDFTGMSIIHHDANDARGLSASYGSGIWCVVGAIIALFISTILVFITCCAGRRKGKHTEPTTTEKIGGKRMLGFGRRRAAAV